MSKSEFIRANRAEIDRMINEEIYRWDGDGGKGTIPDPPPGYSDAERELWLINYEPLYRWAISEGVKL